MAFVSESAPVLRITPHGLYCEAGDFYIDPWKPVDRAVITHAHGDHARVGSASYLTASEGAGILRRRLGDDASITGIPFGERISLGGVDVSLHPAGHIRGSAQVRVAVDGETWVVTGDYKRDADPTCTPFEVVPCHTLVTEATFAFPVYRWSPTRDVIVDVADWWRECKASGRTAILYTYALGKAQRLLAELARLTDEPVWVHGAIETLNDVYRADGVALAATRRVADAAPRDVFAGALVMAPPSSTAPGWLRRFRDPETAFASGWMRLRGTRRRRGLDRGFAISDHADWAGLLQTVAETGASRVIATHGDSSALVRLLRERGLVADSLATEFAGEEDE
jgi:putative mRNA 3-end processing factor